MTEQETEQEDIAGVFVGRIYKLVSTETYKVYVGSTIRKLKERLWEHKKNYKRFARGECSYLSSFEILKYADVKIELIYEGEFKSKCEMCRLEGEYIQTENSVNMRVEGFSRERKKEYRQRNRYIIREKVKQYEERNKDQIKERKALYYQEHREERLQKCKEYQTKNMEAVKERKKAYRDKTKDKYYAKFNCDICGGCYTLNNKANHLKTKLHLQAVEDNAKKNRRT